MAEQLSYADWKAQRNQSGATDQYSATPEPTNTGAQNTGIGGDVVDLAQQGALESVSGMADFVGAEKVADYFGDWAGEQSETLSPEMRESMAKRFINDDLTIGEGAKDWRAWLGQAAKLTGQMATTVVPGGAVGKGVQLLGAGAKAAKIAQGTTLVATNVASAGGMQGQGIAEEINSMSFRDLTGSEEFKRTAQEYSKQGLPAAEALTKARSDLADKAQSDVMYDPSLAVINGVGGYLGDAVMGKLIKGGLGKSIKANIAKGIVAEAPTEAAQGGFGQYVTNIAAQDAGLERDAMQGVYAAALEEGLIAGGVGGGAGAIGGTGRAVIDKLDKRVKTQEKIEGAAAESVQKLSESGASEEQIKAAVGPKLENAAMAQGHDQQEAAEIAAQTIDYALGRKPSVVDRQNNALKRFQEADMTGLKQPDPAQYGLSPQDAEMLTDPPINLIDPRSGYFLPNAPKELMQRYQQLVNSEGGKAYEQADSDYRMGIRSRAPGDYDKEIFGTQEQTAAATAEAGQPAIEQPVQEGTPLDVSATQDLPADQSLYDLGEGYQPTEAAQRIRQEQGTSDRENVIREQSTQEPDPRYQPRERMDEPTPAGMQAVQRSRLEQQFDESHPSDDVMRQQDIDLAESDQAQTDTEAAEAVEAAQRQTPDEMVRQEQDVVESQRQAGDQPRPSELTPQQQVDYHRDRGQQFGTLGGAKLGDRTAKGSSSRVTKKKQKKLDADLQSIYDRVTQANPSVEPEMQQFGEAPNSAMAEAFARLKKTEKKPTKEDQIERVWDLADTGAITEGKAQALVDEIEGVEPKAVEPEKAPVQPEKQPETPKPEPVKTVGTLTADETADALAKMDVLQAKVKAHKPSKNKRSEAFKKTLSEGEKYSNVKYMAFIGARGREFKAENGLRSDADIGKKPAFTKYIEDWADKNSGSPKKDTGVKWSETQRTKDGELEFDQDVYGETRDQWDARRMAEVKRLRARMKQFEGKDSGGEYSRLQKKANQLVMTHPKDGVFPIEGKMPNLELKQRLTRENTKRQSKTDATSGVQQIYIGKIRDRIEGKDQLTKAETDAINKEIDSILSGKYPDALSSKVADAAAETNTAPTDAQIEAENYKKGKVQMHGLTIAIENPKGSTRSGVDPDGKAWSVTMENHYGDIKRTEGADGDAVDVFIGDKPDSKMVYVIDQLTPHTGDFDEHKVMMGFTTIATAKRAYKANYAQGWKGLGTLTPVKMDAFKEWLKNGDLTKPFAGGPDDPKGGKSLSDQGERGKPTELSKAVVRERVAASREKHGKYANKSLSIEEINNSIDSFSDGTDGYKDFNTVATYAANNIDTIKEDMGKLTKPQIFKILGRGFEARYKSEKKDMVVRIASTTLLDQFRFFMGGGIIQGLTSKEIVLSELGSFTEEQFKAKQQERMDLIEKAKVRNEQNKKALEDPKTLDDYRLYIRANGMDALTDAQVTEVDTLFTEGRLIEQEKEREQAANVQAVAGDIAFEKTETIHSKSGEPRYVVNLTGDRLEGDAYKEVSNKAKQFGGRYVNPVAAKRWGTAPGFQFINESDRDSFANILAGEDVNKGERQERISEFKQDKRVTKLRSMAEDLSTGADASLNQDRKTNTAKRSAEAASATAHAYELKDFANTMTAIADATEKGEVRLLGNLGTKIQLSELDYIMRRIIWSIPKDKVDELTHRDDMSRRHWNDKIDFDTKVRYADYPTPSGQVNQLKYLARQMEDTAGFKQAAKGIQSRIKNLADNDKVVMTGGNWESIVEKIKDFARKDKYNAGEWVKEAFLTADRLRKMGITGKPSLRYALRELNQVKSGVKTSKPKADPVKVSEQGIKETLFANRNPWNDFFPTPENESNDVVERADIKPGMKVLEPNAGMGHIADKIRDSGGYVDLDVLELASKLREHLELKGHNVVGDDFLEFKPGPIYDRIVMNPPFSKDQDIQHINHAYSMLKPGGKIVAITSSMAGDRGNSANKNFRSFLDEIDATETPIAEGAFDKSFNPTSVNTKIIELEKPLDPIDTALAEGIEIDFSDIQFSQSSVVSDSVKGTSVSDVNFAAEQFLDNYKGLEDVNVMVVPDQASLSELTDVPPANTVKGAWLSGSNTVVLVAGNIEGMADARKVLRHELIAHKGLMESLSDPEVEALTAKVMNTRNNNSLKAIWNDVNSAEAGSPDSVKAEEVIARIAETERGSLGKLADQVITWVMGAIRRTGLVGRETITVSEIRNMINNIDKTLRHGSDKQYKRDAVRFSQSQNPQKTIDEILNRTKKPVFKRAMDAIKGNSVVDAAMRNKFSVLTLRQLVEVGGKYFGNTLNDYQKEVDALQTTQNILASEVGVLTQDMIKWTKKNPKDSKKLTDMMHESTLANVDPSESFSTNIELLETEKARLERHLTQISSDTGEHFKKKRVQTRKRIEDIKQEIDSEPHRRLTWALQREKFQKLSPETKAHFRSTRDHYTSQRNRYKDALIKSIERAVEDKAVKKEMLRQIRFDNELAEKGLYFPLARFGDYWADFADENGERRFQMYESKAELMADVEALQKDGVEVNFGENIHKAPSSQDASLSFVGEVISGIKATNINDKAKDAMSDMVYQLYLQSMPDRSIRKSFIHRKGVAGFSEDAFRAMADQGFKQSRQQARLEHMDTLNAYMKQMDDIRNPKPDAEGNKPDRVNNIEADRVLSEMERRHEWVQNPKRGAWAQKLTGLGFVWLLGLTPAAALINLTQNVQVAIPVIGSDFGVAKTSRYMSGAMADFMKGVPKFYKGGNKNGIIGNSLEGNELQAIKDAIQRGIIDVTQTADLVGLAENPTAKYTGRWDKFMGIVGGGFHYAEVLNREVTYMTAYRLSYEKSKDHSSAVDYAVKATIDSHFDYNSLNRARFMQGDVAAVAMQFKQYSQQMSYFLWSNTAKALKGQTPEIKKKAQKQLLWTMINTFAIGGAGALPIWMITGALNAAQAAFGDDDDPFDAEVEAKAMMAEYWGPEITAYFWHGTMPSVSSRISLGDLWMRAPSYDMDPADTFMHYAQQLAGPSFGIAYSVLGRGPKDLANEQYSRGFEAMMPKFGRDVLKTARYINEGGVYNRQGDALVDDVDWMELGQQALGFTPGRVAMQYDQNSAMKGYQAHAKKRRQQLMNSYYMAYRNEDAEGKAGVLRKIRLWNKSEYGRNAPISNKNIKQSIKRRLKNLQSSDDGVLADKRFKKLLEPYKYYG